VQWEGWETNVIVEILLVCFLAKIKRYKLTYLFKSWTFYPVLAAQILLVVSEFSIFFHTYAFMPLVPFLEPAVILSFLFALFVFRLYRPAVLGSASILAGTVLNRIVLAQNDGKMPVFPSLSYLTGYVTPQMFSSVDSLHILGGPDTKLPWLTDYVDFGYSILSLGDVFIHFFFCVMLFSLIRAVNLSYGFHNK